MKLKLLRTKFGEKLTNGQLYVDDVFFCFTLEDVVREDGRDVSKWKIPHETAIPRGIYKLTLEDSPKFGPETPTINNVPGYTGVRMHAGNTPEDTDGCIILGFKLSPEGLIVPGTTKPAVAELKAKLRASKEATIQIV